MHPTRRSWISLICLCLIGAPGPDPTYANAASFTIEDPKGALSRTEAPVSIPVKLSEGELNAACANRLLLSRPGRKEVIPYQWQVGASTENLRIVFLLPIDATARTKFTLRETPLPSATVVRADRDPVTGQAEVTDAGKPVLRYNYRTVDPGDLLGKVSPANLIYAKPRSDYIHPLYGLQGEILTRDWPLDHPHHRGIYWGWAEVDYGTNRGDFHALQKVFARPTGRIRFESGPVFAEVDAENEWSWEDREVIVRERVVIRAYRATAASRVVDMAFYYTAVKEGVSVARRGTDQYGGCLNVRLATPQAQTITTNTLPGRSQPAWADLSGTFTQTTGPSGLTVIQCAANPDYPDDWMQYPELSFFHPAFPAARTRWHLSLTKPLVLRYRLLIHRGATPEKQRGQDWWEAFNSTQAPRPAVE